LRFDITTFHTPWIEQFPLHQPAGKADAASASRHRFSTLSTLGGLSREGSSWQFEPTLPSELQIERIWISCSGFQITFQGEKTFKMLNRGNGFWMGESPSTVTPELFSTRDDLQSEASLTWLETGSEHVVLMTSSTPTGNRFVMGVSSSDSLDDLKEKASALLSDNADFQKAWSDTLREREQWSTAFPESIEQEAPLLALERIAACLEPTPNGLRFSAEYENATPFLLEALAATGRDLCQQVINGLPTDSPTAWPVMAQCLNRLKAQLETPLTLSSAAAGCERSVITALGDWTPDSPSLPQWPHAETALTPEICDTGLTVFDYSALLIAEMEACAILKSDSSLFASEIQALRSRIEEKFWSTKRKAFFDQTAEGEQAKRLTVGTLLPLLWKKPPTEIRKSLDVKSTGSELLAATGLRQWEPRDQDASPPPVRLTTQHLLLPLLDKTSDENSSRLSAAWHRLLQSDAEADPILHAALALRLLPYEHKVNPELEKYPAWVLTLEKHRKGIIGTAAALIFLTPVLFGILYAMRPKYGTMEEHMAASRADSLRTLQKTEQAEAVYTDLLQKSSSTSNFAQYHLLRGNLRYKDQDYEAALADYLDAVRLDEEKLLHSARWNLAQVYRELGRTKEAIDSFRAFIDEYGEELPMYKDRAELAISLIQSNLK
jgi:tetratricopeptide (TPR) repeat protein